MDLLKDFLRQKAPKPGNEMPQYYAKALQTTAVLLSVYFLGSFLLFGLTCGFWAVVPLIAAAIMGGILLTLKRMGPRTGGLLESLVLEGWCLWSVHYFGWGASTQQFLIVALMLAFFNVYEKPHLKIVFCATLMALRMVLFVHSTRHEELYTLGRQARLVFQAFNTVSIYALLASLCIRFSMSTQNTERQLRIDNQELHREAGTDPLTQLSNRRAMKDEIGAYLKRSPNTPFGVAIADIDYFKKVNDTYGHDCGDYTLRTLAEKFRTFGNGRYKAYRLGGEEFCFFMPEMNLDEAGALMHDLCFAVSKLPLSFEGVDFGITITIGVSENDFHSPMADILEEADRKLYLGKNSGRNQVVI